MRRWIRVPVVLLALSSCAWVRLTEAGTEVQLREAEEVTECAYLGTASAMTKEKLIVARKSAKVREELQALARNEAGAMGGNAIVADTSVVDGRQSFKVFRCATEGADG